MTGRRVLGLDGEVFDGVDDFGPLHFSQLKAMARSPAHYLVARATPRQENQPVAALRFGTLVHRLVLGGRDVVVYPGKRFQGNAWKDFEAANPGTFIVKAEEHDRASAVARVLLEHPIAGPLLEGDRERAITWELDGRPAHSTPDVMGPGFLTDLKMTANAEPEWFKRHAVRMHYVTQLACYRMAARFHGLPIDKGYLVAAEMRPPFAVTCLGLTERALLEGEKTLRLWLEQLRACELAREWPEYVQTLQTLDLVEDVVMFGDVAGEREELVDEPLEEAV